MDEQTFNSQEINEFYQEDFINVNFDHSTSQTFDTQSEITDTNSSVTSSTSSLPSSLVWEHFDKNPPHASGYNVCKTCSIKYKLSTGISTLRKHLKDYHQVQVPARSNRRQKTIIGVKPFDEREHAEHTTYLIQWLICDLQPFTTVDDPYFRAFVKHFCPRYIIPERHQVKELIITTFNDQRANLIRQLHQIEGQFSLTADMWTSMNRDAFLGITIHYIDSNWCLCNFLLDIIPFTTRHTGENIASEIKRVLDEFNISGKIIALTTDNESAMVVCGRRLAVSLDSQLSLMTFSHYRCTAHVLNLGVKQGLELVGDSINKVRELMSRIKNSTTLCDQLRSFCNLKNIPNYKPILDVETRWNSTYYMLRRVEQLKMALVLLVADNDNIKSLYPNEDDWIIIKVIWC